MLISTTAIDAQKPTTDEINVVAENLNCPTCQALNLADCGTQTCIQWKDQIGDLLAEGYTQEEILSWYAETYGEQVLQEPRLHGVGLYAWLLPLIILLLGVLCYTLIIRQWSTSTTDTAENDADAQTTMETDAYLKRVEQELAD